MKIIDMRKHFTPSKYGYIPGTVPQNAWNFGLVIQDRNIRGSTKGLRRNAIPFQYLQEGTIPSFSKQANYDDILIPGRFEQIRSYQNSSANEITLNLVYVAEGTDDPSKSTKAPLELSDNKFIASIQKSNFPQYYETNGLTFWTIEQIDRICAKIESLVFPQYDGSYAPPRFCLLNIGSVYIDFPVIIKQIDIQNAGPYTTRDVKPFRRNIAITASSYFPTYQAIGAQDILNVALKTSFSGSTTEQPRSIYSFRKFSTRKR
jgi:hypothetical protein